MHKFSLITAFALMTFAFAADEDQYYRWFGAPIESPETEIHAEGRIFERSDVKKYDGSVQMFESSMYAHIPLYSDCNNELTFNLHGSYLGLNDKGFSSEELSLPSKVKRSLYSNLPSDLADVRFGMAYRHEYGNGWQLGVGGTFGSASDDIFAHSETLVWSGAAFLKVPHGEYNAFYFYVDYDSNRAEHWMRKYPIPGIGYLFPLSETTYFMIGAPMSMFHWEPVERLKIDASYVALTSANSRITFDITDRFSVYTGYKTNSQRYIDSKAHDTDQGFNYTDQRANVGIDFKFNDCISFGIDSGYAWKRHLWAGEKLRHRHDNDIKLNNGWYGGAALNISF